MKNIQFNARPDAWTILRFVPFSKSEILEIIPTLDLSPRVEPARIGQYHESDFGLPGELVDKGA